MKAPRLGALALEAEGWLRLFRGGVFEDNFLDISGIDADAWETARAELTAASLLAVEWDVLLAGRPYLRLPEAKTPAGAAPAAVHARYIEAYRGTMMAVRQAFHGPSPKLGMDIMVREEANFRQAVAWARDLGDHAKASEMADLFTRYLERAGRADDRDRWVAWLAGEGPDEEAAAPVEEAAVPARGAIGDHDALPGGDHPTAHRPGLRRPTRVATGSILSILRWDRRKAVVRVDPGRESRRRPCR